MFEGNIDGAQSRRHVYSTTGLGGGGEIMSLTVLVMRLTPVSICSCGGEGGRE